METALINTLALLVIMIVLAVAGGWDVSKQRHHRQTRQDDTE